MFYLVVFFLQIVLFTHLTAWSGHFVLCWRFSLDICRSLRDQIYKAGWGLLSETVTKVILSGELFYFAQRSTGYWRGLWCFVFL